MTLLICVWHAIHVDIDYTGREYTGPVGLILWAIFAPEVVVAAAVEQWLNARRMVTAFRGMSSSILNTQRQTNLRTKRMGISGL